MAMLSFDIRDLESNAVVVDGAINVDDTIWQAGDPVPSDTLRVSGRLSSAGDGRFYSHCRIAGSAVLSCRRCLTDTTVAVEDEAHLICAADDGEDADDPDVHTYGSRDRELDLRPAVRELWLLNAPTFALCRDDCKGLCPTCGADLNTNPCHCPPAHDSAWDTLHRLDSASTQ